MPSVPLGRSQHSSVRQGRQAAPDVSGLAGGDLDTIAIRVLTTGPSPSPFGCMVTGAVLFLALSCLQGRPQGEAFRTLVALAPDGIQFTPGNLPTAGFRSLVEASPMAMRFHHGFAWDAYRVPVYSGRALVLNATGLRSLHPPKADTGPFTDWLTGAQAGYVIAETMYPGYHLGSGKELEEAMEAGLRLAVDVSHLHIQRIRGVVDDGQLARVLDYDRIDEIHVSDNDGRADQHRQISAGTPLLGWALERASVGVPLVYESYLHRVSEDDRRRQLDLVRH